MSEDTYDWEKKRSVKAIVTLMSLIVILVCAMIVGISLGPISIPFKETILICLHKLHIIDYAGFSDQLWVVITEVCLPRVLVACLVGGALVVLCGALIGMLCEI